jgi:hypothetical protein
MVPDGALMAYLLVSLMVPDGALMVFLKVPDGA